MSWRVKREQGYILANGEETIFYSRTETTYEYPTPEAAAAAWASTHLDADQLWWPYKNGHQALTDVRFAREYTDLGIVTLITDRVYFVADAAVRDASPSHTPGESTLAVAS